MNILILMPMLDDWTCAAEVLQRIDGVFTSQEDSIRVLLVDDGSSQPAPSRFGQGPYRKLAGVSLLVLKKNVGHQRALALGLFHLCDAIPCDLVVVMDSDGEDEPADALRMVEAVKANGQTAIVFAERSKRSESMVFKIGYACYCALHLLLTGKQIKFGNFSALPFRFTSGLTVEPMLWNHYAASVVRSRVPIELLPTVRGMRIAGKSRLNLSSLIIHGLSAIACYNETVGVRVLLLMGIPLVLNIATIFLIIGIKFFTNLAIPGWTSQVVILAIILLLQMVTLMVNFVLQASGNRAVQPFLPARDYKWFIKDHVTLYPPAS
jgi:glycosyltransferase involved in cell wall biosynthesis